MSVPPNVLAQILAALKAKGGGGMPDGLAAEQPGFLNPLPTANSVSPAAHGPLTIPADETAVAHNMGSLATAIPEESLAAEAEHAPHGAVVQDAARSRHAADRALAQILQVVSKQSGQRKVQ